MSQELKNIPVQTTVQRIPYTKRISKAFTGLSTWDPKMEAKWLGLNDLSMKIVIIDTLTIYRILHIMEVTQNLHEWLTIDEL